MLHWQDMNNISLSLQNSTILFYKNTELSHHLFSRVQMCPYTLSLLIRYKKRRIADRQYICRLLNIDYLDIRKMFFQMKFFHGIQPYTLLFFHYKTHFWDKLYRFCRPDIGQQNKRLILRCYTKMRCLE